MGEFEIASGSEGRGEVAALNDEGKGGYDSQDGAALLRGGHATARVGSFQAIAEGSSELSSWEGDALKVITDDAVLSHIETIPRAQPAGMTTLLGNDDISSPRKACNSISCTVIQLALLTLKSQMATITRPITHKI